MQHPSGYTIDDVVAAGKERLARFSFEQFKPDFLGLVSLNIDRGWPITSGVRPAHQVTSEILTSGEHIYFENDLLVPGEIARAYIRLLSPEHYPHCLHEGMEINMNEGSRIIGSVKIEKIYNDLLVSDS